MNRKREGLIHRSVIREKAIIIVVWNSWNVLNVSFDSLQQKYWTQEK